MKFGRQMQKNSKYYCKKTSTVYNAF